MELLKKLVNVQGLSGDESKVRKLIKAEIKNYVDDIKVDKFGNLIAHKKGKGEKVMVAAHMDEIGLMIKRIKTNGQILFSTIGGIEPLTLIGQKVSIISSKKGKICHGVISIEELHEDFEVEELPKHEDLYIDTGLNKKELKKKGVEIGQYVVVKKDFDTLGNKNIIMGKALDDRIGCYILIQVAKKLKQTNKDIYFVFTVQEEIGLYGAKVSVYEVEPDWGIAIDVTNAEDATDEPNITIGKGPVVLVKDSEIITNKCLDDILRKISKKKKIKLQLKVEDEGTTDATKIMMYKEGIPSTIMGVAVRNLHSPTSVAHMDDVRDTIKMILELLKSKTKVCLV